MENKAFFDFSLKCNWKTKNFERETDPRRDSSLEQEFCKNVQRVERSGSSEEENTARLFQIKFPHVQRCSVVVRKVHLDQQRPILY